MEQPGRESPLVFETGKPTLNAKPHVLHDVIDLGRADTTGEQRPKRRSARSPATTLHAHVDPEIVLEDVRVPGNAGQRMLTSSVIDLLDVEVGRVTFQLAAIGNDDIAGLVSHLVGAAFLGLAPKDPFRTSPATPTAAEASIAACISGLGC